MHAPLRRGQTTSFEAACMSPTALAAVAALRSKQRSGTHLSDLRQSWSQCAPKMVKALSTASADDAKNTSTGL